MTVKLRDFDYNNLLDSDFCLSPILARLDIGEKSVLVKVRGRETERVKGSGIWRQWEGPRCLWELGRGRREG